MTNLERYKKEVASMLKDKGVVLCDYIKKIDGDYSDCLYCYFDSKISCCDYGKFVNWLLEEFKEPIKLKKWEYDLLDFYSDRNDQFGYYILLSDLKAKGYFKGVEDTSLMIKYILENCEVIDDDSAEE